ncbi:MAG TPA: hypothetical protein PKE45_00075, partial [Caldilineaceae bacterium]|nr:hypothetical protein [Caldilineaceae bacterium]
MPCLFAVGAAFFPRIALLLLLFFTDLFQQAFDGWFIPLLGIVFLPFTTLMYVFAAAPLGSMNFWGWFSVFLGFLLDLMQWYTAYLKRNNV